MDLVILVAVLCLIGLFVWILTTKIPMPPMWASVIQWGALLVVLFYLVQRFIPLPNILPR